MTAYTGGCSCGAVRYEIAAEPIRSFQCQCRDCQRDTGGGHASVMVFPRAAMQVTGDVFENLRTGDSGAEKRKGFCGKCGSPLYNKTKNVPDLVGVYFGRLEYPSRLKAQLVLFD